MGASRLSAIVERLVKAYGKPKFLVTTDPFELVLYENVAYLVDDDLRLKAFENLKSPIGTRPIDILSATHEFFNRCAVMDND